MAVSFEPRARLLQLSRQMQLPFMLLSDPERDAYRAYGLRRGRLRHIFGPSALWTYLRLLSQGRRYHARRSDLFQLGGDFVLDSRGVVRFEYSSVTPSDRPPVEKLLEVLEEI